MLDFTSDLTVIYLILFMFLTAVGFITKGFIWFLCASAAIILLGGTINDPGLWAIVTLIVFVELVGGIFASRQA